MIAKESLRSDDEIGTPVLPTLYRSFEWSNETGWALDLPVETRVTAEGDGVVVRADVPQTRTRTAFDRPLGRLALHLTAQARS